MGTQYSRDTNQVLMGEARHDNGMQLMSQSLIQEGEDEQSDPTPISQFEKIPMFEATEGELERRTGVTKAGCAQLCISNTACRAFQVNPHKQLCVLMDKALKFGGDFDYYAR